MMNISQDRPAIEDDGQNAPHELSDTDVEAIQGAGRGWSRRSAGHTRGRSDD